MKKSTLITTIAMIVVVVVALSTATYAWFSSATTTSVHDEITTTASSKWIIMGGKQTTSGTTDTIAYSSATAINLTLLNGLYAPTGIISGNPNSASVSATYTTSYFYEAVQDGTGLVSDAKSAIGKTVDPKTSDTATSAANYIRVINTYSEPQALVLTITVLTNGDTDSDFYAANGFSTYVGWVKGGTGEGLTGSACTQYYYGDCATTTSTDGKDTYYVAHRDGVQAKTNAVYQQTIDEHNENARAGSGISIGDGYVDAATMKTAGTPLTIGGEEILTGKYYQIKITIADSTHKIATNTAVNIVFYAWFDGWAIDNTGSNSNATVYYEFGEE